MRYICRPMRLIAALLLLVIAALALPGMAQASPHHATSTHPTSTAAQPVEDCPSHAGRQDRAPESGHRSCCSIGCSMTVLAGLPLAEMPRPPRGRHELPLPSQPPRGVQPDLLFRPPR